MLPGSKILLRSRRHSAASTLATFLRFRFVPDARPPTRDVSSKQVLASRFEPRARDPGRPRRCLRRRQSDKQRSSSFGFRIVRGWIPAFEKALQETRGQAPLLKLRICQNLAKEGNVIA